MSTSEGTGGSGSSSLLLFSLSVEDLHSFINVAIIDLLDLRVVDSHGVTAAAAVLDLGVVEPVGVVPLLVARSLWPHGLSDPAVTGHPLHCGAQNHHYLTVFFWGQFPGGRRCKIYEVLRLEALQVNGSLVQDGG